MSCIVRQLKFSNSLYCSFFKYKIKRYSFNGNSSMVFSYLKTNLPNFENCADGLSRDFPNDFNSYFVHILIEIHNILPTVVKIIIVH